ncbi:hypothetical protein NG783_10550 [Aliarcobacter cryaerophilus]|uniref:hypothetical protein n=1 Tax=Aliarcobacter cryaerophilus TaxID=28198 RepID=UPI003DA5B2A8
MKSKLEFLQSFISKQQLNSLEYLLKSEEKQYAKEKIDYFFDLIQKMPKSYETDGQGDKAITYLHYFKSGIDFYITEKDMEDEQLQAFGLVNMNGEFELGYINIQEILELNFELDLNFVPKKLKEIN